jgi:hypothetical protein
VLIDCRTFAFDKVIRALRLRDNPYISTERFVFEFLCLDEAYWPMRNRKNWEKVFILQYYHASMTLFADFMSKFTDSYVERRRTYFDPRKFQLREWLLKEITRDFGHCQQIKEVGHDLATTLESLIGIVKAVVPEGHGNFAELEPVLRAFCKDMVSRLDRLSHGMENDLKFLDLARNITQVNSVQRLTVLATIFLPMSLAAGVLSMQSRFKDLGVLLYDFVGVVVLLGAFAVLLFFVMFFLAFMLEQESKLQSNEIYRWIVRRALVVLIFLGVFTLQHLSYHRLWWGCSKTSC